MRPMPTMPRRLPQMRRPSIQVGDQPGHLPSPFSTLAPSVSRRGTASMSAMVMSAVSSLSTFGVLVTVSPFLVAATTSILSTPLPKLAMSLRFGPACVDQRGVDPVGDGRDQHVGLLHRGRQLVLAHRPVVEVQPRVEQLAHARFHLVGQLAGNDDQRFLAAGHRFLECGSVETSLTKTGETRKRYRPAVLSNKRLHR